MRNSIFSNLSYFKVKTDRGFKDLSILNWSCFTELYPGDQSTVVCGISSQQKSRLSWIEKERNIDVFDAKNVVQTLIEAGYTRMSFVDSKTPDYYHPSKSSRLFLNKKMSCSFFTKFIQIL